MSSDRLQYLANFLRDQEYVLDGYRQDLPRTREKGDRRRTELKMKDVEAEIAEAWNELESLLPQEEEKAIAEIIEALPRVQTNSELPPELVAWMQKIYEEVSKPTPNAAAKLKPFLSLTPPFFGIMFEGEFDLEGTIQKYLPTFVRLGSAIRGLPAKK
jgi:hypothetical protein